ncbi:MAG: recombinase family protein [Planctomycetaceae bacterium]|nr:recombinase family protein [Planctomycetaceae bacterium]
MVSGSKTKSGDAISPDVLSTSGDSSRVDELADLGKTTESVEKCHRTIGYARVSTNLQELRSQVDALQKCGVPRDLIFTDKISGAKDSRPGLDACLKELRDGDVLLVWRLDRLGRSVRHLVQLVEELQKKGVGFRSICDGAIDTTSASGELVFMIFSALAQFERRLISERTKAGLAAARARGRMGGRRKIEHFHPKVLTAKSLYRDRTMEISDICKTLGISRSTLYRYVSLGETKTTP